MCTPRSVGSVRGVSDDRERQPEGPGDSSEGVDFVEGQVVKPRYGSLEVTEGPGYIIVKDMATGMFGEGPRYPEALEDLNHALHEYRDVLERQPALSPELRAHLDHLRGERVPNVR